MKCKRTPLYFASIVAAAVAAPLASLTISAAWATTIDFEAQGASAPSGFTGSVDSPLTIGIATFTGGQLLNHESGPSPDQTAVYATISLVAGAYTNPLPISFSQSVGSFSVLVTNVIADTFTVSDNLGDSASQFIDVDSQFTFTLPAATGITSVTIAAANTSTWDFAIDNVTFTPVTVPAPVIGRGFFVLLCVGGMLFGVKLLERTTRRPLSASAAR